MGFTSPRSCRSFIAWGTFWVPYGNLMLAVPTNTFDPSLSNSFDNKGMLYNTYLFFYNFVLQNILIDNVWGIRVYFHFVRLIPKPPAVTTTQASPPNHREPNLLNAVNSCHRGSSNQMFYCVPWY